MKALPPGWGASQQPVFETKLPLAVQLYSVKDLLSKDLLGTLKQVKEAGYDGVEFYGGLRYVAQDIKRALEETGLQIVGWHTPWECLSPENIYATITYNKVIGNQYVVVPWMPDEVLTTRENCLQFAAQLTWVADVLAMHDMVVGYHNHGTEMRPIGTGELPWDIIAQNTPSTVILQHDIGNGLNGGGDMMTALKKYPGRATTLHVKPWAEDGGYNTFYDDANCKIDWDEYFNICRKQAGVRWYIVEFENEERFPEGAMAAIVAAAKWFRGRDA